MAQMKITYEDKINNIPIVDREKQVAAEDLNEIKEVVNANADDATNTTQSLTGTSITQNCSVSVNSKLTLTANTVLTLENLTDGMSGNIKVTQDSTGGWWIGLNPSPAIINNSEGSFEIPISETADAVSIISWWYDGVDLNVTYGNDYKGGVLS